MLKIDKLRNRLNIKTANRVIGGREEWGRIVLSYSQTLNVIRVFLTCININKIF